MNYMIIGVGGTGGSLAAALESGGMPVTAIARGKHLEAMQTHGLKVIDMHGRETLHCNIQASSMDAYHGQPDVIINAVKDYSLDETIPFMARVLHAKTVIIPISNIFNTGRRIQSVLPDALVTDGCIYISAEIAEPGVIRKYNTSMKLLFGPRTSHDNRPILKIIADELISCGIEAVLSQAIQRDAFIKFSFVSAFATTGACYDADTGTIRRSSEMTNFLLALVRENQAVAEAMGIQFETPLIDTAIARMNFNPDNVRASFQRDLDKGGPNEMDGLIMAIIRLGQQYGIPVPVHEQAALRLANHYHPLHQSGSIEAYSRLGRA